MLLCLSTIAHPPIRHGYALLGRDGEAAIERVKKARWEANGGHVDLVSAIIRIRQDLEQAGVRIDVTHVKGQQDRVVGHHLTFMERLNVRVDATAQLFNVTCRDQGMQARDADVGGEIGPIWINLPDCGRIKIYSDLIPSAHDEFHGSLLRSYWIGHGQ
jgi:hypothetical protein